LWHDQRESKGISECKPQSRAEFVTKCVAISFFNHLPNNRTDRGPPRPQLRLRVHRRAHLRVQTPVARLSRASPSGSSSSISRPSSSPSSSPASTPRVLPSSSHGAQVLHQVPLLVHRRVLPQAKRPVFLRVPAPAQTKKSAIDLSLHQRILLRRPF
jgi:hypothetical protein